MSNEGELHCGRPRRQPEIARKPSDESMTRYGKINDKTSDDPDPAYMHYCGEKPLRRDSSSSDGINSSIELDEEDLDAVDVKTGENVRLYIEANGRWLETNRATYNSRPGVGLPLDLRRELNLEPEDTIHVWLDTPADAERSSGVDDFVDREGSTSEEDETKNQYVWLMDTESTTYHEIHEGKNETVCGINFEGQDHKTLSDPGDVLEECEDCARIPSGDMSNRELVEWLADADRADFEVEGDAPSYLSKGELISLRDYIFQLEQRLEDYQSKLEDYSENSGVKVDE